MFYVSITKRQNVEASACRIPDGTFEEEHGRKGFYGKSAHLYHTHPPTGWIRFEGKLRPHCIDCNKLKPTDQKDPKGTPVAFLGNNDVTLYVSRRSKPMPFYFRNADGDELYFVHRGEGIIETDFGPLEFEKGDYIVIPRAVTYRVIPKTKDNFFLIIQSKTEFEQPEKGLIGQHALYDPPSSRRRNRNRISTTTVNGKCASKLMMNFHRLSIRSTRSMWSDGKAI